MPLQVRQLLPMLREWQACGAVGSAAEQRSVRQVLAALSRRPLPNVLGTALYSRLAQLNHSCEPNVEVPPPQSCFIDPRSAQPFVRALASRCLPKVLSATPPS